jgi:hypothetical protein
MKPEDVCQHLAARAAGAPPPLVEARVEAADGVADPRVQEEEAIFRNISSSYFRLRRGLALVAFAFPIVLIVGGGLDQVQTSISAYYHHSSEAASTYGAGAMRNIFVGVLWAMGCFLYFYKGYSKPEDFALDIAGLAALGVSLFPMDWPAAPGVARSTIGMIHYASAVTFFLAIAYVCLFRSGDTLRIFNNEVRRLRFKRVYTSLGTLMIVVPLAIFALHLLLPRAERNFAVLLIEIAGIYVFSAFWLVKSREIALIERQ